MITVTYPSGSIRTFADEDFELFQNELEHKTENIILNTEEPYKSFAYETDCRGEIINRDPINIITQ